ncbi:MAG: hypothetical protein U0R49_09700 [Fimbriimonadales bacterium]
MELFGNIVAALCVVMILSLLWRENKAYRVGEHILLGLAVGYAVVAAWFEYLAPRWMEPFAASLATGNAAGIFSGVVLLALGLCWYGIFFKKTEWLMRLVIGIVIGAGAGQAIRIQTSQQMPVLVSSFRSPIVVENGNTQLWASVSNTIFLLALISVLFFFFFTLDHRNALFRGTSKVGRFWLMVAFGAFFGNTLMTRLSALIERVWFVVDNFFR